MGKADPIVALVLAAALSACGPGEEKAAPEPQPPPQPAPAARKEAPAEDSPFHDEAEEALRLGKRDDAILALKNALMLDPDDAYSNIVLGSLALEGGDPNAAARYFVGALQIRSTDCMLALALSAARRRVDIAAGSEPVLRDILSYAGCPPPAYAVAFERLGRNADPKVGGGVLPAGGPPPGGPVTVRVLHLTAGGPSFSFLADAAQGLFGGELTMLGDQFAVVSAKARIVGHWVSEGLATLEVRVSPGLPRYPDVEPLNHDVDTMLQVWREGLPKGAEGPHWAVGDWVEFRDVRGRFRVETPRGWYANLFHGPDGVLYTFSPVEIDKPGAEPVRSGDYPAFDLLLRERKPGDPPPWSEDAVLAIVEEISSKFTGVEHATDPWVELVGEEDGAPPGVLVKRTFIRGDDVYRAAAAQVAGGGYLFSFAFGGQAERFDLLEADFWRFVRSLRPLGAAEGGDGSD